MESKDADLGLGKIEKVSYVVLTEKRNREREREGAMMETTKSMADKIKQNDYNLDLTKARLGRIWIRYRESYKATKEKARVRTGEKGGRLS